MKRKIDDETREIITAFVIEGYERLDEAEAKLGQLGAVGDRETLNAVFRLFHSIKGSAGYLGFDAIKALTHEAESMLDLFLKEGVACDQDSLDAIYETMDLLRELVGMVESTYSDAEGAERAAAQSAKLAERVAFLRAAGCPPGESGEPSGSGGAEAVAQNAAPPPAAGEAQSNGLPNRIPLNELVSRDMAESFVAESADLLTAVERDAISLDSGEEFEERINAMFRAVHTIKGNAGFFAYAALEALCMELEQFLDLGRKRPASINEAFVNVSLARVDAIRSLLSKVTYEEAAVGASPAPRAPESRSASEAFEPPAAPTPVPGYQPLGEILIEMGAASESAVAEALEQQERPVGRILLEAGEVQPEQLEKALERQKATIGERGPSEDLVRREVRVDTVKLDKLFDLVGELITAEAMVANSPDLRGLKLDHFEKSFQALAKISREIQETAMIVRMIPLEGLFHKMSRLVRDLSRKFGKPVELRVSGAETEMDKNVIEQVSDPLVHILRNAIDHGVESSERRRLAGKAATGSVELDARYEGSEIWISVKDDGGGLDRERILAKAIEKGLCKADPESLSDEDVWAFIFEPGFSTAASVSEVSGRGVGMDVVKRNLEAIRGRVKVRSAAGRGSEFILQIPLTMAIIDGITVRIGRSNYSVPLNDILEFFKARPEQITHVEGSEETVQLRGAVMPLIKLAEVFAVPGAILDPCEGIILVAQHAGRRVCLLIDEVVGNQQIVIKSLSEYIGTVPGLAGCSILGDGSVSFIVDTGRLIGRRLE